MIEAFYFHEYTRKTVGGRPEIWYSIYENAEDYFARRLSVYMLARQDAILPDDERKQPLGNKNRLKRTI